MLFTPDARSPTGTPVLGWHDLAYTVQGSGAASATKEVLSDLTGYARAGKVLGVMGPSGAGKARHCADASL